MSKKKPWIGKKPHDGHEAQAWATKSLWLGRKLEDGHEAQVGYKEAPGFSRKKSQVGQEAWSWRGTHMISKRPHIFQEESSFISSVMIVFESDSSNWGGIFGV